MDSIFLREDEAWRFLAAIPDAKERLLSEVAMATALAYLTCDPDYALRLKATPVDLLHFAGAIASFCRKTRTIGGILSGEIKTFDDIEPFSSR
jgi:hypothetical protein